ncbi:MAG: response regulator [Deltaproteobacteria bacterium]|nr:response regulator [Deltaproteobacteria bacterium]
MITEKTTSEISFKPRILVVDDEKRIRDGCRKVLTQEGFEVAVAENGEQGLKMIEEAHYDITLLDLMMPGLSGFDVLAHVKTLHPDTVIIVITGYATVEHSIEAMKKGAFDFIPKPFSPDQLRVVVSKAIEYTGTLQDIANEKSRMRVLINQLDSGVMATNNKKRVALANPSFLKMMGYRGETVIGRRVEEFIKDEKLMQMIDQAISMPQDQFTELTEELYLEDKGEDQEIILGARCVPFRDRLSRNLGTITVLHDITTLKKMNQLKSDFVSMVSHEIRSPMNSILAQLKVVLDGLAGDITEKQKEILGRASERIKALSDLSTELLDLARIESGLITQEKEELNMDELLADQVDFHNAKAQAKNIRLELTPLSKLPPVLANRHNMEEVLSNLITNAVNYTPEGGSITVSATVEGHYLCVGVMDTGIGMTKEDVDRIFDRFYRVKNDKTRFITGTGLGLPIVKSIMDAHNGMIRVESTPDQGSSFYVYIPLVTS